MGHTGRVAHLEEKLGVLQRELDSAHDETDVVRKESLAARKELAIAAEKLHQAEEGARLSAEHTSKLEAEVVAVNAELETRKRPAVAEASTQTSNRREDELMDLMRRLSLIHI